MSQNEKVEKHSTLRPPHMFLQLPSFLPLHTAKIPQRCPCLLFGPAECLLMGPLNEPKLKICSVCQFPWYKYSHRG